MVISAYCYYVSMFAINDFDSKHVKTNCKATYARNRWRDRTGTARHMAAHQCGIWMYLVRIDCSMNVECLVMLDCLLILMLQM